jgi:hypothetical protein
MARKLGAKGKIPGLAKDNIQCVFTRLGGTAAMAKWARANPTEFYKIYARLLPTETQEGNGPVTIRIIKFGDEEIKLPPLTTKKLEVVPKAQLPASELVPLEYNASE